MDMQFLPKLIGETITTHCQDPPNSDIYPPRDWIVLEKLSEHPAPILPEDVAQGLGSPFTVGRYLCRRAGTGNENENELAFMRIYKQIPHQGTEFETLNIRQGQAIGPPRHIELYALKYLTENGCTATPKLLGYRFDNQEAYLGDIFPGGYIIYFVWEKVPGEPLNKNEFWSLPYHQRERIRDKFKTAYLEFLKFGFKALSPVPRHIILDRTTGDIKITGLRRAMCRKTKNEKEWNDDIFVAYHLVLPTTAYDKYIPNMASDLNTIESNGWRW